MSYLSRHIAEVRDFDIDFQFECRSFHYQWIGFFSSIQDNAGQVVWYFHIIVPLNNDTGILSEEPNVMQVRLKIVRN